MSYSPTKENNRKPGHGVSGKSDNRCKVCSDLSDGLHFSIYACRACTAFFRRSIVLEKKYVCRKGGDCCKIDKTVGRAMCRKCRYRKCLDVGMSEEMVQKKKEANEKNSVSSSPTGTTQDSENEDMHGHHPASSSQANSSDGEYPDQPEALFKIMRNYRAYWEKQAATENVIKANFPQNVFKGEYPGLDRVTCRLSYRIGRTKRPHLLEFMATTFPEFMGLDEIDQRSVVTHFFLTMWVLDCAYRTYLHIPSSEYSKKSVHLQTSYIDIDCLTEFTSDLANSRFGPACIAGTMKQSFGSERAKVVVEMNKIKITEEELCALIALTVWNTIMEGCTLAIENIAKNVRKQIYQQLGIWYRASGITEFAERMGEVMDLITTVLEGKCRLKLDMEMYNFLEAFKDDEDMKTANFFKMDALRDSLPGAVEKKNPNNLHSAEVSPQYSNPNL